MRRKSNLYLYLALVCLVGIIAIFIVDGYLGIYDTVYITYQEHEKRIAPDYWQDSWVEERGYSIGVEWGESIHFQYEIDNRTFSSYVTDVEASVWKSGDMIIDLLDEDVSVAAFDKVSVNWTVPADELEEAGYGIGEYTVKIKHNEVERKIVVGFHSQEGSMPIKVPPPPSR